MSSAVDHNSAHAARITRGEGKVMPTPLMRRKNRIGKTDGDQKRQRRSND